MYNINEKYVGQKLEIYLREELGFSGRYIRKMHYILNGKPISFRTKIPAKGILTIQTKDKNTEIDSIKPIKLNLNIIYEDDDLLIVNKPPFLLVHPTQKIADVTLANGIRYYFNENGIKEKVRFYNRLDMNTSGLIIIAKNPRVQHLLQSKDTIITKKYLALVENIFPDNVSHIEIEKNILQIDNEIKRIVDKNGQYAKTIVNIVKNYNRFNISLVECELKTGRTHQIRIHLNHIKHPILGDSLYNESSKFKVNRQMLHSYYLKIYNKGWGKNIEVKIDIPQDMKSLIPEGEN